MDHLPGQDHDQSDDPGQPLANLLDIQDFLTLAEAAAQLGISDKTIRRWIKSGKLRATLMEGAHGQEYRVWKPDLHPPIEHQSPENSLARVEIPVLAPLTPIPNLDTFIELITSAIHDADAQDRARLEESLASLRSSMERLELHLLSPQPRWWQFWKR